MLKRAAIVLVALAALAGMSACDEVAGGAAVEAAETAGAGAVATSTEVGAEGVVAEAGGAAVREVESGQAADPPAATEAAPRPEASEHDGVEEAVDHIGSEVVGHVFDSQHQQSGATAALSPAQTIATAPDWVTPPDAAMLARYYPAAAQGTWLRGRVLLHCTVNLDGTLACAVASEQPEGAGFGSAAQQMSKSFVMRPETVNGVPVAGGQIMIPIAFEPA